MHLMNGSALKDAGTGNGAPLTDIDGAERDIGADEI